MVEFSTLFDLTGPTGIKTSAALNEITIDASIKERARKKMQI
jgi:hypothetical protein